MPPLLFLTQRIPYPPIKGEKIRPLQILRHLAQSWDVHLGCLVDDPRDQEHVPTVAALCAGSHFATLDRRRAKLLCLTGLLTGEPLSVTFYRDAGLAAWVRGVMRDVRPAAVFVCSSNMAPYVLDLPVTGVRLCDLADVDSEKWRAYADTGAGPSGSDAGGGAFEGTASSSARTIACASRNRASGVRLVHAREWRRTAALEGRIAREFDWSTFVSAEEAALFAGQHPGEAARIRAISSGVDAAYFDPVPGYPVPYPDDRANFVFTGTMDYPPNMDAAAWFAGAILPIIRRTLPNAAFHIVGSSPAPQVLALAGDGVTVTGRVPDVRPYVAHAVCVAPMRIARGIQNKVLEAMAMARPVVVTPDALEGIGAQPGTEVLLADTADAFAAACIQATRDGGQEIGRAARRRVLQDYVWASRLRGFDALLPQKGTPA